MFIKKKLVEGYCQNCREIKQGYKKTFKLSLYTLFIFIVYIVLAISFPDQMDPLAFLFWVELAVGIGYKIYFFFKEKKRCFTCNEELID
jgi:multidrug efflux pump subunit AcrB